jgi:3-phenylpropionate/trans-cinnamate dioxygenase ferredoxin reductase subunit
VPGAVVVGAGLAGLRAAQALRRHGFEGELAIIGDEPHPPYNRPPLSKDVLAGTSEPDSCLLPADGLEATWLLGRTATALDPQHKLITLDDGEQLGYDKLVIATGCRPRPWPAPLELAGLHVLRTLDEAIALRDAVRSCGHVTVVGAGFLGCEAAATLRAQGIDVALIDIAPHPMPALGQEIGERAVRLHVANGVDLRLGTSVAGFDGRERVEAVRLADGARIETELVLVALGALANVEWLAGSGLAVQAGGVLCDQHGLVVGAPDVAAAGDVAAWPHPGAGGVIRVEHWANAAEMAMRVAANLLATPAGRQPHAPVLTFWSDQYDVKIRAAGMISGASARQVVREEPTSGLLVVEGRREGRLVAGVTFNSAGDHMRHRRELALAA